MSDKTEEIKESKLLNAVSLGELLNCPDCNGKGTVKRYPYYSTNMPERIDDICETCAGHGKILIIDTNYKIYYKGDI